MKLSAAVLLGALVTGSSAFAQAYGEGGLPPGERGDFMQACGADVHMHCPSAKTPRERHMCIRENRDNISRKCTSYLAQRHMEETQGMQAQRD
jgi:hypothetical protein